MRKINLSEIKETFDDFLKRETSREDISSWALELQDAQDSNLLIYNSPEDEEIIWDAIQFLVGVDLKISPKEYLHNISDVENYKRKL